MSDTAQTPSSSHAELPKQYRPADHESRTWTRWEESRAFNANAARVVAGQATPYSVVIPPPNVTDRLHLGHALNNTLQDILVRTHRMRGHEALWMPGTDHAGIATQAVVEKRVWNEERKRRHDFTREDFIKRIQAFKDEYESVITGQLKKMGCSCDWDRQRFTMDDVCARAVREAFFQLFKDGLIYRGQRLVNWDPVLQTAVADDECFDEEVDAAFYYLRYPLVHAHGQSTAGERRHGKLPPADAVPVTWSELSRRGLAEADNHPPEDPAYIVVATTRPETYLGDTAVAVNPHDPRAKALRGLCVELPLVGRVIPIVEDEYVVLPEIYARDDEERADPKAAYATGFLKVTPAHDANDYDLYQRHKEVMDMFAGGPNAALVNVFAPDATVSDKHGWHDVGSAHLFVGKSRDDARTLVIDEFKARGLLERTRPYRHSVTRSDRSKAIIEPYLSDQWYVKVTDPRLAAAANKALAPSGGPPPGGPPLRGGSFPSSLLDHSIPPLSPPGFIGMDPYPPGQASPSSMITTRQFLPHVELPGATYFVTWRVADGSHLADGERDIVLSSLLHHDSSRVDLCAACVMSNHVHCIVRCLEGTRLSDWLASVKRFSARQINAARGAAGHLWQDESLDHVIRDSRSFSEFLEYIVRNPVDAGAVHQATEYRWTHVSHSTLHALATTLETPASERRATTERVSSDGQLRFHPDRYAKTFELWHDNIRDWCISRQLWWGHRVPVWEFALKPGDHADLLQWDADVAQAFCNWAKAENIDGDIHIASFSPGRALLHVAARTQNAQNKIESLLRLLDNTVKTYSPSKLDDDDDPASLVVSPEELGLTSCPALCDLEAALESGKQDPDVLDTWFSSALWPMSTMGWPDPKAAGPAFDGLLAAFNPTSTLCTAREIITLWVSRMVMMNRYLMPEGWNASRAGETASLASHGKGHGPLPFRDVFIHCVIQDGQGQKMSKSLGNGVDPLDIIASHGADAMRFTLCNMATQTQDVRMPVDLICPHTGAIFTPKMFTNKDGYVVPAPIQECPTDKSKKTVTVYGVASGEAKPTPDMPLAKNTSSKFDLGRNFANKLWNAARFAVSMLSSGTPAADRVDLAKLSLVDRWMISRLAAATRQIDECVAQFDFAGYAQTLYDIVWRDFCDWYLEAIKPSVAADASQKLVLRAALDVLLRLAHPVMPFITETIFEHLCSTPVRSQSWLELDESPSALLCRAAWPRFAAGAEDANCVHEFTRMQTLATAIREVRAQHNVPPKRKIVLHAPSACSRLVESHSPLLRAFVPIESIESITGDGVKGPNVAFVFESMEWKASNLADAVDASAERSRLEKAIADKENSLRTLSARLANPGYADRAPPAMVQQTRDQLAKAEAELAANRAALSSLGAS
ncbi:MAG: class I tRNA ligase family protein [Phycisphaerales bacterium]|nr:class I tRNA ligase family protein [Phycisphaerales bacterium]